MRSPPYSYQHTPPTVVNVDEEKGMISSSSSAADDGYYEFFQQRRPRICGNRRRRGCGLLIPWSQSTVMLAGIIVAVTMLGSIAFRNSNTPNSNSSSSISGWEYLSASMTAEGPPGPPDQQEGTYDWQKCQHSEDPDCWKKEGERVGTFWQNFGTEMSTYWSKWGHNMHDYWENVIHHNDTTTTVPSVNITEILPEVQDVMETFTNMTAEVHHHSHHHDEALVP